MAMLKLSNITYDISKKLYEIAGAKLKDELPNKRLFGEWDFKTYLKLNWRKLTNINVSGRIRLPIYQII